VIWMIIALQAIQPTGWISFRTTVPWLAVFLGMASTYPTLFAVFWEEEAWGLRHSGDILGDFIYFMGGVGPREEILKLAFFLPLLPLLWKRQSRLETLIIGACVGLGFAVQENLQYFQMAGPANAFGRFLTANFFHMAATGVLCLALCDALRDPLRKGLVFLGTLAAVMMAHGAYDAFVAIPELHYLKFVSIISFIILSRFFFDRLRRLRDCVTDHFSIAATLAIGLAALVGVIFVCASVQMGFVPACASLGYSSLGLLVFFVMFYRQLGEGMSAAALEQPAAVYR
jgi:protease PrsW